nr:hypothetical protein [uncultured Duganella sp.]
MKKLFATGILLFSALVVNAQTWQCVNHETGYSYVANQEVPRDSCRLIDAKRNPHPDAPDRPVPRQLLKAGSCNKSAAMDVRTMLDEFAKTHIEGDHLAVHWIYKIEKESEPKRLKMVQTYADMDACLSGGAREIMFYRKNKLMGIASPDTGVRLVK